MSKPNCRIVDERASQSPSAGVIDAMGEDVHGWAVGDAVLYHGAPAQTRTISRFY
jgi:hypothetical protein